MGYPAMRHAGFWGMGVLVALCFGPMRAAPRAQADDEEGRSDGPAQVLIIRHGEKPGDPSAPDDPTDRGLSTRGRERAAALAYSIPDAFPRPDFLFATKDSDSSKRPGETIAPLAARLKLDVDQKYADKDYCELAKEILGHPKYAGKRVLICWHHGKIPDLAAALKAPVPPDKQKWGGNVFDRVWQLDYSAGSATLTDLPQRLLYGDSAD